MGIHDWSQSVFFCIPSFIHSFGKRKKNQIVRNGLISKRHMLLHNLIVKLKGGERKENKPEAQNKQTKNNLNNSPPPNFGSIFFFCSEPSKITAALRFTAGGERKEHVQLWIKYFSSKSTTPTLTRFKSLVNMFSPHLLFIYHTKIVVVNLKLHY